MMGVLNMISDICPSLPIKDVRKIESVIDDLWRYTRLNRDSLDSERHTAYCRQAVFLLATRMEKQQELHEKEVRELSGKLRDIRRRLTCAEGSIHGMLTELEKPTYSPSKLNDG